VDSWREGRHYPAGLNTDVRPALGTFAAERLDEPLVPESPYTAYAQFIGLTQPALCHVGQIALLKRALLIGPNPAA
jgi:hypothetical protein